jgi:hypothetical protein
METVFFFGFPTADNHSHTIPMFLPLLVGLSSMMEMFLAPALPAAISLRAAFMNFL